MAHDWKTLYISFRDLWHHYSCANTDQARGRWVLQFAIHPKHSFNQVLREANKLSVAINLHADWSKIEALREAHEEWADIGYDVEDPAASVYQTALQILDLQLESERDIENKQAWFFRGQRSVQWEVSPKILRNLPAENPREEFLTRLDRVRRVVRALQDVGLGSNQFEALAIAQHYSAELRSSTWLLDVTTSPYVALFFASDGGEEGDIGVIDYILRAEWLLFSSGDETLVGDIRYISPSGIPRIEIQAAFFIDAPHPKLYRQMENRRFFFRQQPGVTFEDSSLSPPVTHNHIYPTNDPVIRKLPKDWEKKPSVALSHEPTLGYIQELDGQMFFSMIQAWLGSSLYQDQEKLNLARIICKLHAAIIKFQDKLPHQIETLHHLLHTIENISFLNTKDLLKICYLNHIENDIAIDAFAQCLIEACPEWEAIARNVKHLRTGV